MKMTPRVRKILSHYESDNPGTKSNLARILMQGRLAGTGKLVILPVDQGFEHGPARSFAPNPPAYDPHYHFQLAIDAGLSAYAAPLGMIEAGAGTFAGQIPTDPQAQQRQQPVAAEGRCGPGGDRQRQRCAEASAARLSALPSTRARMRPIEQFEEIRELAEEAKSVGLAVVIWSYPRGGDPLQGGRDGDRHLRLCRAHGGAARRPHHQGEAADRRPRAWTPPSKVYESQDHIPIGTMTERIRNVVQACFNGRRIVVFSGGENKGDVNALYSEIRETAATAARTARSSAATPSSVRAKKPWPC